jgi:WD40 repeat protein
MNKSKFILAAALLGAAAFAHADNTRVWRQDHFEDFDKGTPTNVSMRSDGVLLLAPRFRALGDPQLTYIWAMVEDSRGRLYAAGGSPGKLVRVTDDKIETIFTSKELEIHSLAVDDKDNIYAATSPDPKIYKIAPDGTSSVFYEPQAKYVWSMAWDPAGFLYIATGDKGEIFRVDRGGQGMLFFSTDDVHARSMVLEKRKTPNGSLIVGTDPGGLILRVTPGPDGMGKGFVLYQAGKKEITALAVAEDGPEAGSIYAAAVGDKPVHINLPLMNQGQPQMLAAPPIFTPGTPMAPAVPGGTEVYRIQADGFPRKLWYSRDDVVYAMGFSPAGKLLLATGNKGKLFQIESDTLHTALLKTTSTQLTSLLLSPKGVVYAGSGNIGKIYEMRPEFEHEGSLESEVFDTHLFARWGRVSWKNQTPAGTSVTMSTRSGNVDDPSRNWSAWSHAYKLKAGEPADSPGARFLQWKITLASNDGKSTPLIDEVEIAYLPKNVAPVMEEVEATPGGYRVNSNTVIQPAQPLTISLQPLGQRNNNAPMTVTSFNAPLTLNAQRGSQGVRWAAHDDNDDQLSFTVYLRGVNETGWKLLKDHVADKYYFWDANTFPDGLYVAKVVASDAPSNSEQDALTDERVSPPFIIDNTPPVVEKLKTAREGSRVRVTFTAIDALSVIKRGDFSVDGGEWQFVPPADGIADSLSEAYSFITPELTAGEHVIAVRVFDKAENGTVEKVVVK